jgi:ParB family transcriptional regulator, chromosome partitioning protein
MEKFALGKGLSALIPDNVNLEKGDSISYLSVAQIKKNVLQPRKIFNEEQLSDLVSSIKQRGVLQPLLVRPAADGYELIAGERRLRAAESLNIEKVPVIIKSVDDQESLILALIENIQREELNAIEEAQAYKQLIDRYNFTQDVVAQSVGKSRVTITNTLRLLSLPEEIQKSISQGLFSMGHARALLSLKDSEKQIVLWKKTIENKFSVRELENLVNEKSDAPFKQSKKNVKEQDPYLEKIEQDLRRHLGTKIKISSKKKRGKVVIEFYSSEDLERIIKIIKS